MSTAIYTIISVKGGVGKTTLVMGLAISAARQKPKDKILLIDGDMHVGTVQMKMCPSYKVSLADVFAGEKSWRSACYPCQIFRTGGGRRTPLFSNLDVMPAGERFLPPMRGSQLAHLEDIKKIFDGMTSELRKKYAHVFIDTSASVHLEHLVLTAAADAVVHVVEPDSASIYPTMVVAKELEDILGMKTLGVILNRVPKGVDAAEWVKMASRIGPVLGVVPDDRKVGEISRDKNLPVFVDPATDASKAVFKITEDILEAKPASSKFSARFDHALEVSEKRALQKRSELK